MHFVLGFLTGLLVWLSILIVYHVKGWDFPPGPGSRFLQRVRGGRYILNAVYWAIIGGAANLVVDIEHVFRQWLDFPYRFWHTPALILGAVLAAASVAYLWRAAPHGRRTYASLLVLVVGLSFVTHVLQDYLLGWF